MNHTFKPKRILNLFHQAGKQYVDIQEDETLLTLSIEKIMRLTKPDIQNLIEEESDVKKRNALTEKASGRIIKDKATGDLAYDLKGERKMREELRALFDEEIEIPTNIITQYDPKTLTSDLRWIFEGIVIPERNLDEEIANFDRKQPEKPDTNEEQEQP